MATKIKRKEKRIQSRDRTALMHEIELMRKVLRWAENAAAKVAKQKKIPRWERGNDLIRATKPKTWLGQEMNESIHVETVERRAAAHLDNLLTQRDTLNQRKLKIQRKLEMMNNIKEGERPSPSFYHKCAVIHKSEEITALFPLTTSEDQTKTPCTKQSDIGNIATQFL